MRVKPDHQNVTWKNFKTAFQCKGALFAWTVPIVS